MEAAHPLIMAFGALLVLVAVFELWRLVSRLSGTVAVGALQTALGVLGYLQTADLSLAFGAQEAAMVAAVNGAFLTYARLRTSAPVVKRSTQ